MKGKGSDKLNSFYRNDDFFNQLDTNRRGRGFSPMGSPGGFPQGPSVPGFPGGPFGGMPGGMMPGGMMPGGMTPGGPMTPPPSPPPNFTPELRTFQTTTDIRRRGGGRGIGRCFFRNTFVWLTNGTSFWFYPMFAFGNTIVGFRWRGNRGWVYDSINRNRIEFFQCY